MVVTQDDIITLPDISNLFFFIFRIVYGSATSLKSLI